MDSPVRAAAAGRACGFMLTDLAARHTHEELAHIRQAMRLAEDPH